MRIPTALSWLAIVALGCSPARTPSSSPSAPRDAAPSTHIAPQRLLDQGVAVVHRFEARLMGTPWSIAVAGAEAGAARAAAAAAFGEVARIEALMSEWRPDSEISRINAAAGGGYTAVGAETFALVQRGLALGARTEGAFDLTWAALRGLWRFDARPPSLPRRSDLEARLALVGFARVALDPARSAVRLPVAGMALGLGGIAKGYAIDGAARVLRARGLTRFIVDGGGDLYVAGEKAPGQPWTVGVRHPRADRLLATLPARDVAVVSSGDYERYFDLGGTRYHHIIDPATGRPATRSVAVTVQAAEATLADALATAFFVLGPQRGVALAAEMPGVEAAILGPDGSIAATPGLEGAFGGTSWR